MIISSIDIADGQVVQLIGGKELALTAGSPEPLLKKFRIAGEVAVIDLDAARGIGSNLELIRPLLRQGKIRVGGGIRTKEIALDWLDAGAEKIIIGTAAKPDLLSQLPRERLIAAVDSKNGKVVIDGWETETDDVLKERIAELKPYVSGFLVTFVEREGQMVGLDLNAVRQVIDWASPVRVTVAGGLSKVEEVKAVHKLGADVQVGMALYTGSVNLGDAISCLLPEGQLWPTVVCDERNEALGLVYSNAESIRAAVNEQKGIYFSRKRGIWRKGESSGATQELLRIELDCDDDGLRFVVRQNGSGFCHNGTYSCWASSSPLRNLETTLMNRRVQAPSGSYAARLFSEEGLLNSKLCEEAEELARAQTQFEICAEAADLFFFTMAKLVKAGIGLAEVEAELSHRSKVFRKRAGDRKSGE